MPSHDFGVLMALAYQQVITELHAELARHGIKDLRPSYGYVLRTVEEAPINQRQLAALLGVTDQAIGKLVTEMVRRKLLRRRADPDDARARQLVIGAVGETVLRTARRFHAQLEQALVRDLGDDVATTRRVLAHIVTRGDGGLGRARLRLV